MGVSIGKVALIGGVVIGVGYLLMKKLSAAPALPVTSALPGSMMASGPPVPPAGSATMTVPPGPQNSTGLTLTMTQWTTSAGIYALVQNASNPQSDYVVTFGNSTTGAKGITQQGSSSNSALIAQSFAGPLLAAS